jgi:hypothetical protein
VVFAIPVRFENFVNINNLSVQNGHREGFLVNSRVLCKTYGYEDLKRNQNDHRVFFYPKTNIETFVHGPIRVSDYTPVPLSNILRIK